MDNIPDDIREDAERAARAMKQQDWPTVGLIRECVRRKSSDDQRAFETALRAACASRFSTVR